MLQFLSENTHFTFILVLIFAAIIGSFLNVVIYRLPMMMKRDFETECRLFLELEASKPQKKLNLAWPGSFCRSCEKKLSWWANIPLLSYLLLRGRCQHCRGKISAIYPLVELISIITAFILLLYFGLTIKFLATFILTAFLIAITFIDIEHQLAPDQLTLPGLWLGLLFNLNAMFCPIQSAIIGAVIAYLSLWLIANLFKLIRGKDGMGYGDFKVFALLGAWFGWQSLIYVILIASVLGIIFAVLSMLIKKLRFDQPLAFAPYLAIAGWICLFIQPNIFN